ncbi:MAG: hypothetical protein Q4G22_10220 [Paracoccus sp. (in: a-proteobacteria)]|uniref:phage tail assembly chaperone n=1 Tax=Paracoccus sp. TaxID=267 RepID=UPI0026E09BC9|nr:hypothetical protein [Paracoccus sp. (in: a-proteobacteria)]MDO5632200.1 hypothetical protein [Paracoccus sp. (in: a-proteobacteria)]
MKHEKAICATFKAILEHKPARFPEGSDPVVEAFLALNRARTCGPHGPDPISWQAIDAYCRLMQVPLAFGGVQRQRDAVVDFLDDGDRQAGASPVNRVRSHCHVLAVRVSTVNIDKHG